MPTPRHRSRRTFLKESGSVAAAGALSGLPACKSQPEPRGPSTADLAVAVVGCGGRGAGACENTLIANPNVRLVAIADLDAEKVAQKRAYLQSHKQYGSRVTVQDADVYIGLDGIDRVCARDDVDLVILAAPPGFRPEHIKKCVAAKKHVFAEKPVCIDPTGYRICMGADAAARQQGTAIVTGTQYRRQPSFIEAIDRLHQGVLGRIVGMTARYCSRAIWYRERQEGMTDARYQVHNWMHFVWLSGDQICEQAVHNIDAMNWVMQANPTRCYGSGGRFFRPEDSELWDSMSVDYEYPGDRIVSLTCRQWNQVENDADNVVYCEGGVAYIRAFNGGSTLVDHEGKELFTIKGNLGRAYVQEHAELVRSIEDGKPIVELAQTADSSLTAVMGRMSAYTGRKVTWDFVTNSKLELYPKDFSFETAMASPGPAMPGITKLV